MGEVSSIVLAENAHTHLAEAGCWPVYSAVMSHLHKYALTHRPTAVMTPAVVKNISDGKKLVIKSNDFVVCEI